MILAWESKDFAPMELIPIQGHGYKHWAPDGASNCLNLSRNLAHCFHQSFNLIIAGVAGATHAHQAFGLKAQSLNHRRCVEISVRRKQSAFSEPACDFRRSHLIDCERHGRCSRHVGRWTIQAHAPGVRKLLPQMLHLRGTVRAQASERCLQKFATGVRQT